MKYKNLPKNLEWQNDIKKFKSANKKRSNSLKKRYKKGDVGCGFKKDYKPWNTDKKLPEFVKEKIRKSCKGINKKPHIIIKCLYCGKKLEVTFNESKKKKFCSYHCHGKYRIGEKNPNYGKGEKIKGVNNPMANPIYKEKAVRNLMIALKIKPNKCEYKLLKIIKDLRLNYHYNFGEIIIGGKVPDYYHKVKKKLIEFNGDYWHRDDDGSKIKLYKKLGYDCLVIWENELDDVDKLKNKLLKYG